MKRQIWIDVLKGLGIISVVVGHITYNRLLWNTIFMFHMPLFFLLGGWLHNTNISQRTYLKAKAHSLLLPYLSFLLILWPLELLVAFPDQRWTAAWLQTELIKPMLVGGQLLTGFAAVFWFVTSYFLMQQLMHFLLRRYSLQRCALICAVMLVCAYLNALLFRPLWLPWSANAVLIAAPFYCIGYWARSRDIAKFAPVFVVVALTAVALNVFGYHNVFDIKATDYGFPVVTFISALACVAVLAIIARHLQSNILGRGLAAIGGASMTIMFLHQFVQLMMAKKLGISQALPRIAVALLVCYLIHQLFKMSPLTARFFLGLPATKKPFGAADLAASKGIR
ncbi:MAG: acyltransferase family protein [Oxalobacteraceae bacterium]|nr:acyltransferase family protein [Oxalobacteraceae bacterium]